MLVESKIAANLHSSGVLMSEGDGNEECKRVRHRAKIGVYLSIYINRTFLQGKSQIKSNHRFQLSRMAV